MDLKVLRYLVENPRMPISEISNRSGVTSRNV
ncbi:MAG: winged helix-turn-helix domain-containing protein, partial [Candidatus Hodarchaeota archaeon]